MKKIIIFMVLSVMSMAIYAETINATTNATITTTIESLSEEAALIDISRTKDSIVLGANKDQSIQIRLIVSDFGRSDAGSPRYNLYLNYFHVDRINNTRTAFDLGLFMELISTKRIRAGVYEIEAIRFTNIAPSYPSSRIPRCPIFLTAPSQPSCHAIYRKPCRLLPK